jgi:hypothetical protein
LQITIKHDNQNGKNLWFTPHTTGSKENTSTDRDAEILMVGKYKEYNKPCLVMGDMNDVTELHPHDYF